MHIRNRIKTAKPESSFEKSLEQELLSYTNELAEIINNGLKFADNFNCETKTVTDTGLANTEFAVAHTLKRVPTGFIVIKNDKAGVVYNSGTAWTTTNIYLKCSVANCNITVIII